MCFWQKIMGAIDLPFKSSVTLSAYNIVKTCFAIYLEKTISIAFSSSGTDYVVMYVFMEKRRSQLEYILLAFKFFQSNLKFRSYSLHIGRLPGWKITNLRVAILLFSFTC